MHQQRQTCSRNMRQRTLKLLPGYHRKAFAPGINQKALEALHSGLRQWLDMLCVVACNPAPGCPVDEAFPSCRLALGLERRNRRRLGQAVERHVNQRRVSTCRRSARRRPEAFPLRPPWLVDVHMAVYETRQDGQIAKVTDGILRWNCVRQAQASNFASLL